MDHLNPGEGTQGLVAKMRATTGTNFVLCWDVFLESHVNSLTNTLEFKKSQVSKQKSQFLIGMRPENCLPDFHGKLGSAVLDVRRQIPSALW